MRRRPGENPRRRFRVLLVLVVLLVALDNEPEPYIVIVGSRPFLCEIPAARQPFGNSVVTGTTH